MLKEGGARPECQGLTGSSPLIQWGQVPTLDWAGLAVSKGSLAQMVQSWGQQIFTGTLTCDTKTCPNPRLQTAFSPMPSNDQRPCQVWAAAAGVCESDVATHGLQCA